MTEIRIDKLDKPALRIIRDRIDFALGALADDIGIVAKAGNCSYTEDSATFKLDIRIAGAPSKEATDFLRHCQYGHMEGLQASDLNRILTIGGKKYSIEGYKPRSPKHPMLLVRLDDGTRMVFTIPAVVKALKRDDRKAAQ